MEKETASYTHLYRVNGEKAVMVTSIICFHTFSTITKKQLNENWKLNNSVHELFIFKILLIANDLDF